MSSNEESRNSVNIELHFKNGDVTINGEHPPFTEVKMVTLSSDKCYGSDNSSRSAERGTHEIKEKGIVKTALKKLVWTIDITGGYKLDNKNLNLCNIKSSISLDIKVMKIRGVVAQRSIANNLLAKVLTNPYLDLSILNQPIDMMKSDFILRSYFSSITSEIDYFEYGEVKKIWHLYKENKDRILASEYLQIKKEIIKNNEQERYKESGDLLYSFSKKLGDMKNNGEAESSTELLDVCHSKILELSSIFYEKEGLNDKASEAYKKSLQIIGVIK